MFVKLESDNTACKQTAVAVFAAFWLRIAPPRFTERVESAVEEQLSELQKQLLAVKFAKEQQEAAEPREGASGTKRCTHSRDSTLYWRTIFLGFDMLQQQQIPPATLDRA